MEYTKRNAIPHISVPRLRELMERRQLSGNEICRRANLGMGAVRDILSGKVKTPRLDTVAAISDVLDCDPAYLTGQIDTYHLPSEALVATGVVEAPVIGYVQAGNWVEADFLQDEPLDHVTVTRHPNFPNHDYVIFDVRGDSMDKIAPEGSRVVCVPWDKLGMEPRDGLIVVAERCMAGGAICERTVKRLRQIDGKTILMPESTNAQHKPIVMGRPRAEETVRVLALVVSVVNEIRY